MDDKKIQWHSGFVPAMDFELKKNRGELIFKDNHNLNTKPLEIDLLIIKKKAGIQIENEIGRIFKGHNIIEYKGPSDYHLNIDTFYKVTAYACLYKSYGKKVDEIKAEDITITIVREASPQGLLKYFGENGFDVSEPYKGIYYIKNGVLFSTQIVVTSELEWKEHMMLKALTEKLEKQHMRELINYMETLKDKRDIENADSILDISIKANKKIYDDLIGG